MSLCLPSHLAGRVRVLYSPAVSDVMLTELQAALDDLDEALNFFRARNLYATTLKFHRFHKHV